MTPGVCHAQAKRRHNARPVDSKKSLNRETSPLLDRNDISMRNAARNLVSRGRRGHESMRETVEPPDSATGMLFRGSTVAKERGGRKFRIANPKCNTMDKSLSSGPLAPLCSFLDSLTARASVADLQAQLQSAAVTVNDVAEFARFSEHRYLRNLVHEGEHYHLLVLCWRSGQRSPIHDHAGSTCGLRILRGTATETVFERSPGGLIKPVCSEDYCVGDVSVSSDDFIHQVSNLQAQGQDLVTLHVYSPPLLRTATYSLTEPTIGEFRPMVLEHVLGSGI